MEAQYQPFGDPHVSPRARDPFDRFAAAAQQQQAPPPQQQYVPQQLGPPVPAPQLASVQAPQPQNPDQIL
jgi:hypothetical protein